MRTEGLVVKRRMLDIDNGDLLGEMRASKSLNRYSGIRKDAGLPSFYESVPFPRRRFLTIFRLNVVYCLPIRKIVTVSKVEQYQCNMCDARFGKNLAWPHFLYNCRRLPKCPLVFRPDPLSQVAFDFTVSDTRNAKLFKERLILTLELATSKL